MSPRLVNRLVELEELRALPGTSPNLGLLYGRRRVGKTFLLDHAWPSSAFYFLATESTAEVNRGDLLRDWSRWASEPIDAADYPTWRNVYRRFADHARRVGGLIVVLDEFQLLLGHDDDAASQLAAVWDRDVSGAPLTMVLCGSEVSTMEGLLTSGAPLFGRFAWVRQLKSFDYFDAGRLLPGRSARQKAMFFGALGGTPLHSSLVRASEHFDGAMKRLVLAPGGAVRVQLETLLEQERGLREMAEYRAVMTAIANGSATRLDIANATGLTDRTHVVRRALDGLAALGFIEGERPFEAPPNATVRFVVADPAVAFWNRFVVPNRSPLETGLVEEVWKGLVEPHLSQYMGRVFERTARQSFLRHHGAYDLSAPAELGRWEGQDRARRPIEIDLLARTVDGHLVAGEVKWSSRAVGPSIHRDLVRDLEDLARSGRAWAHEVGAPETRFLYFSAAGFDAAFVELAAADRRIRLVTLEEMYAGSDEAQ